MDEIFKARQARLERAVQRAALELFDFTGAAGYMFEIPGTSPPVFIVAGDVNTVLGYISNLRAKRQAAPQ